MSKAQTIKISQPKVLPGQRVLVNNYRKKYGDKEPGMVRTCEFRLSIGGGSWSYSITLDRRTPSKKSYTGAEYGNRLMWLYVGDKDVEAI